MEVYSASVHGGEQRAARVINHEPLGPKHRHEF